MKSDAQAAYFSDHKISYIFPFNTSSVVNPQFSAPLAFMPGMSACYPLWHDTDALKNIAAPGSMECDQAPLLRGQIFRLIQHHLGNPT